MRAIGPEVHQLVEALGDRLRLVVAAEALQALHLGGEPLHLVGVALQLLHLFARGHLHALHALHLLLHLPHLLVGGLAAEKLRVRGRRDYRGSDDAVRQTTVFKASLPWRLF